MITRLENGTVIVELTKYLKNKDITDEIKSAADHGLIYANNKLYHSQDGEHHMGVKSQTLKKIIGDDAKLGRKTVWQLKDAKVAEILVGIVHRWDPVRDKEIYEAAKKNKVGGQVILPIPFVDFMERKDVGSEKDIGRFELFRSFRAYQRNMQEKPLSKKKGVSCGNFVSYSIKAAIVERLFPKGLPEQIVKQMQAMESQKTDKNKKLSGIDQKEFENFENLVKKHFQDAKLESDSDQVLVKELYRTVKSRSIGDFCLDALENPKLWDFKGHVFYRQDDSAPWVMPHDVYLNFAKKNPSHKVVITDEELIAAGFSKDELAATGEKTATLKKL